MREIGGFFEFESYHASVMPEGGVYLNSGRHALKYIIRAYDIRKLYVPAYNCPTVWHAIESENCEMVLYDIDASFKPTCSFPKDAFILYNNYFGVCEQNVRQMVDEYPNVLIDQAQSFYSKPQRLASFYSPRKFFGLPDGGVLYCDKKLNEAFDTDLSFDRCAHLLKRTDLGAAAAYDDFKQNDGALDDKPIQWMSRLTREMMGNINKEDARQKRLQNFKILHEALNDKNELNLSLSSEDVPMVYPLLKSCDGVREKLIANQIFVATYWPGIEEKAAGFPFAMNLKKHLIPLPIDQRYGEQEMLRILEVLNDLH